MGRSSILYLVSFLIVCASVSAADPRPIDTNSTGLMAYFNVGGPIDLAKFSTAAKYQNASGLYRTYYPVLETPNYTEGDVVLVYGCGTVYAEPNPLPSLISSSMHAPLAERETAYGFHTDNTTGWAGGAYSNVLGAKPELGCCCSAGSMSCSSCASGSRQAYQIQLFRVRVRADGWILAYHFRNASYGDFTQRASFLRWRNGAVQAYNGTVDGFIHESILNRTYQVATQSGALLPNATFAPAIVKYYDFQVPNASSMLYFGSGKTAVQPNNLAFAYTLDSRPILDASISVYAVGSYLGAYTLDNKVMVCKNTGQASRISLSEAVYASYNQSRLGHPLTVCNTTYSMLQNPVSGLPFVTAPLNVTAYNLLPGTTHNVTTPNSDAKLVFLFYFGSG